MTGTKVFPCHRLVVFNLHTVGAAGFEEKPRVGTWRKPLQSINEVESDDDDDRGGSGPKSSRTSFLCERMQDILRHANPDMSSDPRVVCDSETGADVVVTHLQTANALDRSHICRWGSLHARTLAVSEHGHRTVTQMVEVAKGSDRDLLVAGMRGGVIQLCKSRYGHKIMMKLVEVMPLHMLVLLLDELVGRSVEIAQHKTGNQFLEYLFVMHGTDPAIAGLVDEVVRDAYRLSRHHCGNIVMQSLVEYGSESCRSEILQHLQPYRMSLAKHFYGSCVVRRLLETRDVEEQSFFGSLLHSRTSLISLACSRGGSVTLVEALELYNEGQIEVPPAKELQIRLLEVLPQLLKSKYGRRVANHINFPYQQET